MQSYTNAALSRKRHDAVPVKPHPILTTGGQVIFRRTRRPVSTCNLIAVLAGIGQLEAR